MTTHTVKSFGELKALILRHAKQREGKVRKAVRTAARKGARILKGNVPVAFGELREDIEAIDHFIIVGAPHGAAVNNGSRPHWMPLGPLIAWVKLRGMQGLHTERQIGRLPGTSTRGAAQGVAAMLASHEHRGPGGYSDVDAAEQVARAIQRAIAKRGTKPHHFMERSLPDIYAALGEELHKAMSEDVGGGDGVEFPATTGTPPATTPRVKAPDTRRRDNRGKFVKH